MISKGDLVKLHLVLGDGSEGTKDLFILGRMMNYCDEEESYIVEPTAISITKDQVADATRLPEDFDFENASEELSSHGEARKRELAPDILNIRVSKNGH
jgi:hypothetical protein